MPTTLPSRLPDRSDGRLSRATGLVALWALALLALTLPTHPAQTASFDVIETVLR